MEHRVEILPKQMQLTSSARPRLQPFDRCVRSGTSLMALTSGGGGGGGGV